MAILDQQPCYLLMHAPSDFQPPSETQLKRDLEFGTSEKKLSALKAIILMQLNGERLTGLFTYILRFLLPSNDHAIKKTLLLFWEIFPKRNADGKLLDEMILVCETYRKDLQHPNEFIRGSTLRFVGKLKEPELLTTLIPAVKSSLTHRAAYVRRNAILAIFTIHKHFPALVPDGSELIKEFLEKEQDMFCQRNAFLTLLYSDEREALKFLSSRLDQIPNFCDTLQLIIVKLIYKICHDSPNERSRFIRSIYSLLNSFSPSVSYEAACTLTTLSNAPTAIRASATCFINLVIQESDNNVKMIVFDKLTTLKDMPLLKDLVIDILRVLSCSCFDLKTKTLDLVLHLATKRHVEAIVLILKQETSRVRQVSNEDSNRYSQLLVQTYHSLCLKFPHIVGAVLPVTIEFISDSDEMVSHQVTAFLREIASKFVPVRGIVVEKLMEAFSLISSAKVLRSAVWILGEFAVSKEALKKSLKTILRNLEGEAGGLNDTPKLIRFLMNGDYFVATSTIICLTKLTMKVKVFVKEDKESCQFYNRSVLRVCELLNLLKNVGKEMSDDTMKRMYSCLQALQDEFSFVKCLFIDKNKQALAKMLSRQKQDLTFKKIPQPTSVDSPIFFFQLSSFNFADLGTKNMFELSLDQALSDSDSSRDSTRVAQLTGMADPVYVEAQINLSRFNICLEVLIVNQTLDTLTNCSLELATIGELKLFDKPQSVNLGPRESSQVQTSVKVTSTENSIIFGSLTYENRNGQSHCVVLNDIYIDIMDYIAPAVCSDFEFQKMWSSFEWENKVTIDTCHGQLFDYFRHVLRSTNMRCLTPEKVFDGAKCDFLAANMYAKSIFGEDALANLSVENSLTGRIFGHVRVRAKSQGMALSLGEKFNSTQKK